MKQNDAEPQRESRSVEDKKKLTKAGPREEREECCLQKSRLAPSFEGETKKRKTESEERERPSNQSQWTRWRERERGLPEPCV